MTFIERAPVSPRKTRENRGSKSKKRINEENDFHSFDFVEEENSASEVSSISGEAGSFKMVKQSVNDIANLAKSLELSSNPVYYSEKLSKEENIMLNCRLVSKIANRFSNTRIPFDDLFSIGMIGLIKAYNTFDISKGVTIGTYAGRCIENEILMHLRVERKSSKSGRQLLSLEHPIGVDKEGNEVHLEDIIGTEKDAIESDIISNRMVSNILKYINNLGKRQNFIMTRRLGLGCEKMTQKEIANELGLSRSYISRIEQRTKKKLIVELINEYGVEILEGREGFSVGKLQNIINDIRRSIQTQPNSMTQESITALQSLVLKESKTDSVGDTKNSTKKNVLPPAESSENNINEKVILRVIIKEENESDMTPLEITQEETRRTGKRKGGVTFANEVSLLIKEFEEAGTLEENVKALTPSEIEVSKYLAGMFGTGIITPTEYMKMKKINTNSGIYSQLKSVKRKLTAVKNGMPIAEARKLKAVNTTAKQLKENKDERSDSKIHKKSAQSNKVNNNRDFAGISPKEKLIRDILDFDDQKLTLLSTLMEKIKDPQKQEFLNYALGFTNEQAGLLLDLINKHGLFSKA